MPLTEDETLLMACRAMNPFVNGDLLIKDPGGNVVVAPGAPQFPISKVLAELHQNDVDFGLHAVDHVLDSLRVYCREAGYSLAMGPNELLDAKLIKTIRSLARWIEGACSPIRPV